MMLSTSVTFLSISFSFNILGKYAGCYYSSTRIVLRCLNIFSSTWLWLYPIFSCSRTSILNSFGYSLNPSTYSILSICLLFIKSSLIWISGNSLNSSFSFRNLVVSYSLSSSSILPLWLFCRTMSRNATALL